MTVEQTARDAPLGACLTGVKIAHVTTVDASLRFQLFNQLRAVQEAGFELTTISAEGPEVSALTAVGIQHVAVPMSRKITPLVDLVSLWRLYRTMRTERFSIVHTHTPKAGLLAQLAATLARTPVVVNTVHGFYFHENTPPLWRKFFVVLERIAALNSDIILSVNREDVQTAIREGICAPEKIKYIGEGIDVVRFDPDQVNPASVQMKRAELRLPEGAPVIGFVGRQVREKGLLDLFAAARLIRDQVPDAHFVFIGPVDHAKADAVYPEEADAFGIADVSRFTGMRLDLPELYALMDVVVLPSYREGFGRALIEASAMRKPTVASDIRGCREAVADGRTGFLFPVGNAVEMAERIVTLVSDQGLAARMGREGRAMVLESYDERTVNSSILREYCRLIQQKQVPVRP